MKRQKPKRLPAEFSAQRQKETEAAIKRIRERRKNAPKVSIEELIAWKNEGRI